MKSIVLFTAFSPSTGGGGTNLRSILPDIQKRFEVVWLYTAGSAVAGREEGWIGLPVIGWDNPAKDFVRTSMILGGKRSDRIQEIVTRLLAIPADAYWVVSHNEGLRVALELTQRSERPVHLTIQDDWAAALCAKSRRYRLLAPLARGLSDRTIKAVKSLDVTSNGMRDYYRQRTNVDSVVVHPVVREALAPTVDRCPVKEVTVGHAGSIYSIGEFLIFAKALAAYAKDTQRSAEIRMWGTHLVADDLPKEAQKMVTMSPACDEQFLVRELACCSFLYAMYPLRKGLQIFTQTSFPTKLSTYVQAQRPILGHGPDRSTLATFLRDTQTGVIWSNVDVQDGVRRIRFLMEQSFERRKWELARELYYGDANVRIMLQTFEKLCVNSKRHLI